MANDADGRAAFMRVWNQRFAGWDLAKWDQPVPDEMCNRILRDAKKVSKIDVERFIRDLTAESQRPQNAHGE